MDKDILRIVIIVVGAIVILAMVLWSAYKNKRRHREINFYDSGNPLENIDESLVVNTDNDDFDIVPLDTAGNEVHEVETLSSADKYFQPSAQSEEPSAEIPKIIQFSIVAREDDGFHGAELKKTFEKVGLVYGTLKVFERLDSNRLVDFTVASMVEPGTFPEQDEMAGFSCPGIVFFMQPLEVQNRMAVFKDFIQTINWLAEELEGAVWDHQRQLLTEETIREFYRILI